MTSFHLGRTASCRNCAQIRCYNRNLVPSFSSESNILVMQVKCETPRSKKQSQSADYVVTLYYYIFLKDFATVEISASEGSQIAIIA